MAAAPTLTPPPEMDSGAPGAPPSAPTTPGAAAPPQPSPADHGTQLAVEIVRMLRSLAMTYPGAAPHVARINDEMRSVMMEILKHQQPGEPAAPPVAG